MNSRSAVQARFEPMSDPALEAVLAVERQAYAHPWLRQNFSDCLRSGYQAQMLLASDTLLGYFVAMPGSEEAHLLNITVAPAYQRQGWAQVMLDGLALWARGRGAHWLWLEVRTGNARAIHVYEAQGFCCVGRRPHYYPAGDGQREDALVMRLALDRHHPP